MKKIINVITTIITSLLFVLTLVVLIIGIRANSQNKIPKVFGYSYSAIVTGSMKPKIGIGDIVISKDVDFEEIVIDDVIIFYSKVENKHIVHRVIRIEEDGSLITKGDANTSEDSSPTTKDNYEGKVVKVIPKIGDLILNYRNLLFGIIIIIFIFIIINEIRHIIKNIIEDKKLKLEKEFKEKYNLIENQDEKEKKT